MGTEGKATLLFSLAPVARNRDRGQFLPMSRKQYAEGALEKEVPQMSKDAKKIAKEVVKGLKELDRKGELARAGEKVAKAINNLREERRLTPRELNRRATI